MLEFDKLVEEGGLKALADRFKHMLHPSLEGLEGNIEFIAPKHDGSLISTFMHNNNLHLKTKGAIDSDQAIEATKWLQRDENKDFYLQLLDYTKMGYTCNLEWVSPMNRIVLPYSKSELILLNIRHIDTGEYTWVLEDYTLPKTAEFVHSVAASKDAIEGYVVGLKDGLWFKVKTDKYRELHQLKDSVTNPKSLLHIIVNEGVDELRSLFFDDSMTMEIIDNAEKQIKPLYNNFVRTVQHYYNENELIDRKSYAVGAQKELPRVYLGPVMALYSKKPFSFQEYFIKNANELGYVFNNQEQDKE